MRRRVCDLKCAVSPTSSWRRPGPITPRVGLVGGTGAGVLSIDHAVWVLAFARTTPVDLPDCLARNVEESNLHFPPAQERQSLEQMHVLLVLEQRAVQRPDQLARVAFAQLLDAHVFVEQQLEPVQELRGGGLL